jgi:dephospho-CoA kinase
MKIIGIGGTNGSGKDTLAQFLVEQYGYLFVSVSDILRQEVISLDLPLERENTRKVSAQMRRTHGSGVLVDMAVRQYRGLEPRAPGLVIASLRNPGEADRIHELGGRVVWLDADPKVRYAKIESRLRSPEDHKTFKQFLAEEQAEMRHHGGDPATLSMVGVKAKADIFVTNDTDDLETFKAAAQAALGL